MRNTRLVLLLALASCGPVGGGRGNPNPGDPQPDSGQKMTGDPNADLDGDGFTPAQGDCDDNDATVYPGAPETCDGRDHNCNGVVDDICDDDKDGYNVCPNPMCPTIMGNGRPGGDCNDADPLVNPGAYEFVGNMVDDDCNGMTDEATPACPAFSTTDARSFPAAFELCAPWLMSATINGDSDARARQSRTHYGVIKPKQGPSFTVFSTGIVADEQDASFMSPQPGTEFSNMDANPLPMNNKNLSCGNNDPDPKTVNDMVMLTMTLKVPTNAKSFSFNLQFMSSEYPEFVGSMFNDKFLAILSSKAFSGNISFDAHNNPITVNAGFFDVCTSAQICNGSKTNKCTAPVTGLNNTGYEQDDGSGTPVGGGTGWLTTTSPIQPGETATLKFAVFDEGDAQYDSAIILDNFQWQLMPATAPTTVQ